MISPKTKQEIELMAAGGAILARVLEDLGGKVAVGMTGKRLDEMAQRMLDEHKTAPAFLGYGGTGKNGFPAALCVSVNDGVVHGLPNDVPFKQGDVVKLDLGLIYEGLYLDSAHTFTVGEVAHEVQALIDDTKKSLDIGIKAAVLGGTTGDIGYAIQEFLDSKGLGIVRQLVGHGVGYGVHEDPQVPNFGKKGKGATLVEGLVIAIEPMVTLGDPDVVTDRHDGWTVRTAAGVVAAHEEHTIAITKNGPRILTALA